jgi:hypothetical protein
MIWIVHRSNMGAAPWLRQGAREDVNRRDPSTRQRKVSPSLWMEKSVQKKDVFHCGNKPRRAP